MKVISRKNLPSQSPLPGTALWTTVLHYWNAPQWLWGAMGLIFLLVWIRWVILIIKEKPVDILEDAD